MAGEHPHQLMPQTSASRLAPSHEKLLRTIDRMADWARLTPRPLAADVLMEAALRRAGRKDFSNRSFVGPLKHLLRAYNEEADLSVFGNYAARFDVLRCLGNLLDFDAAEDAKPDIVNRRIVRPIFIAGLPRSGTTFLHTLLAQDPANAVPRFWQLIYPYPLRTCFANSDCRRTRVARQLNVFRHLSPELDELHPIATDAPQECTDITAQVFQSLRFDTTHRVPSYLRWIDGHGHDEAYRFHRRFLQHLDAQAPGRQWILKCPDHVFALDAIRAVYPDAEIVLLHRDPLSVLASVAKLTELLRRPFSRRVDREEIGREVSSRWAEGADRMVAAASRNGANRILHLHYREVVSAPMETVAGLYRHCGLTLSEEAARQMRTYLHRVPRGGYGVHRYSLTEFGLDAAHLCDRFARYMDVFGIASGNGCLASSHLHVRSAA